MNARSHASIAISPLATVLAILLALLAAGGCEEQGPDTTSFRVVLLEPTSFSTNVPCPDTIRVTFNNPIDTTATFDVGTPKYFRAFLTPGAIFDSLGVVLSNDGRTLILPFIFGPNTTYTFDFVLAQDQEGRLLESRARTTFTTAPSGALGCP